MCTLCSHTVYYEITGMLFKLLYPNLGRFINLVSKVVLIRIYHDKDVINTLHNVQYLKLSKVSTSLQTFLVMFEHFKL
jgi:hypothetical protein